MQNIHPKTPTQANYRILNLIEQMVAVAPKGTDLGLCDLISAMFSGYFIESGGAVMPAIEAFLRQEVKGEKEREARSRRAAKALTYPARRRAAPLEASAWPCEAPSDARTQPSGLRS